MTEKKDQINTADQPLDFDNYEAMLIYDLFDTLYTKWYIDVRLHLRS
jgi:hypothetical protein